MLSQTATVYSNDPAKPKIILTLAGEVIPAAFIEPKAARLIGKTDEDIRVDINITPPKNNIFDISKISAEDGSNIRFQLEKRDTAASRNFIIHVFNTKPDAGRYVDRITMTTTSTISPELTVRVFGIIRD